MDFRTLPDRTCAQCAFWLATKVCAKVGDLHWEHKLWRCLRFRVQSYVSAFNIQSLVSRKPEVFRTYLVGTSFETLTINQRAKGHRAKGVRGIYVFFGLGILCVSLFSSRLLSCFVDVCARGGQNNSSLFSYFWKPVVQLVNLIRFDVHKAGVLHAIFSVIPLEWLAKKNELRFIPVNKTRVQKSSGIFQTFPFLLKLLPKYWKICSSRLIPEQFLLS